MKYFHISHSISLECESKIFSSLSTLNRDFNSGGIKMEALSVHFGVLVQTLQQ